MTTDGSSTNDDTQKSDIVRPSLSLRKRHQNLLDKLQRARYASRSEATRAAIESHAKSVLGDGKTGIELISKQVNQLEGQINELADQVEEIQQHSRVGSNTDLSSQSGSDTTSRQEGPTAESTETQGSGKLQDAIYTVLSEHGEMSVPEIAEQVGEDPLSVRENVEHLIENYGFVTCTEQTDSPRYEIK